MELNNIKPKVSIITVCYNEEKDIEETCKSVVSQHYENYEWIVIDGGSTDATLDILKKFNSHISVLVSEKDRGVYDAMNKGIRLANGEYLIFLNGGDSFFNDDVLRSVFEGNSYTGDILFGNCRVLKKDEQELVLDFAEKIKKDYFLSTCINHQSTFIRRELFEKCGAYDEKFKILADFEKWITFCKNGFVFEKVPFVVSNFKGYDGLSSQEKTRILTETERREILNMHFNWCEIILHRFKKWYSDKFHRLIFAIFSPKKFFKKYIAMVLNSKYRQPARKIWNSIKLK